MRKALYIGISFLFTVSVCFCVDVNAQTTWYVPADFPTIQAAVNGAAAGDTIIVSAGTYSENIIIDKTLTLEGAGYSSPGTTIIPALSAPNPCTGSSLCGGAASSIILVRANDVVIRKFSLDGDNPGLTSGIVRFGADLDARNGIIVDHSAGSFTGLEVAYCMVSNIYLRGINATSGGTFNIHDNIVFNVQGDDYSIGIFAWGGPGAITDNSVDFCNDAISANHSKGIQFLRNSVSESLSGIHTDNAGDSSGAVADLIKDNFIDATSVPEGAGSYGIWTFVPYIAPVVEDNQVWACDVGLSAWGQGAAVTHVYRNNLVITGGARPGSVGAYITTDLISWGYSDVSVEFEGNGIGGCDTGIYLTADPQSWNPYPYAAKTIDAVFFQNNISNNVIGVAKGTQGTYNADATCNYWGSATGPYHSTNPLGTGNSVCDGVPFENWSTIPAPYDCDGCIPPDTTITSVSPICPLSEGNSASVTEPPSGGTYSWTISGGTITSGTDTRAITFTAGAAPGPVSLGVAVTRNDTGCSAEGALNVSLDSETHITIQPGSTSVCSGGGTTLSVTAEGANLSYQWYQGSSGDTTTPLGTAETQSTGSLTSTTSFWVRVTGTCGTTDSETATVTVLTGPFASSFVDDGYAGLPAGTHVDWPYTGNGTHVIGCDAFDTVQGAVDATAPGGTVNVAPGTYTGTINIEGRAGLTVAGSGRDTTTFRPATTILCNVSGFPAARRCALRVINSQNINFSGVTFDYATIAANDRLGVFYWNSSGSHSANRYMNMSRPDASNYYTEVTSYWRANDSPWTADNRAPVAITGCEFIDTGRLAVCTHHFVHATITNNTFTKTTDDFGYALEIGSRSTAAVSNNSFSNFDKPASDHSTAAAIYVENSQTAGLPHCDKPVSITGNSITGCQYGIWIGNEWDGYTGDVDIAVTMTGNTITNSAVAVSGEPAGGVFAVDEDRESGSSVTLSASGNTLTNIDGPGYEFVTYGDGELHSSVTSDFIMGCVAGFSVYEDPSVAAHDSLYDISFHFCRIVGNTTGGENLLDPGYYPTPLSAEHNWWGCNYGPGVTGTGCTTANGIAGNNLYDPWLSLTLAATPSAVRFSESCGLSANFFKDNHGMTVSGGAIPNGTPVSFAGILGTVADASGVTTSGQATTTFTAGTVAGINGASATVDGQTVHTVTVYENMPEVSANSSGYPIMVTVNGTDPNLVDIQFQDVGALNYNVYVSNSRVTHPFIAGDPATGNKQCNIAGVVAGGTGYKNAEGVSLETGITGSTAVLYFMITADDNVMNSEGPMGFDSAAVERTADIYCNR